MLFYRILSHFFKCPEQDSSLITKFPLLACSKIRTKVSCAILLLVWAFLVLFWLNFSWTVFFFDLLWNFFENESLQKVYTNFIYSFIPEFSWFSRIPSFYSLFMFDSYLLIFGFGVYWPISFVVDISKKDLCVYIFNWIKNHDEGIYRGLCFVPTIIFFFLYWDLFFIETDVLDIASCFEFFYMLIISYIFGKAYPRNLELSVPHLIAFECWLFLLTSIIIVCFYL